MAKSQMLSIAQQKCPRCRKGRLFSSSNPYDLKRMFEMPTNCETCGQPYQLEPSFFYGAMYVNYGLTVAIGMMVFVAMSMLKSDWKLFEYLIGIVCFIIALAPVTFRLGRSIWIHLFVKYEKDAAHSSDRSQ